MLGLHAGTCWDMLGRMPEAIGLQIGSGARGAEDSAGPTECCALPRWHPRRPRMHPGMIPSMYPSMIPRRVPNTSLGC